MPNQFGPTFIQQLVYPGSSLDYIPTLTQLGAVTNTPFATYMLVGKLVFVWFGLTITAAGTTNNAITVSLPVTAKAGIVAATGPVGTGYYVDTGTANYPLVVFVATASTLQFRRTDTQPTNVFGVDPNIAMANGDFIYGSAVYEAA